MPVTTNNESLDLNSLTAVSSVDGRYARHTEPLRVYCSEFGLIRYRVVVEVRWLRHLAGRPDIPELGAVGDVEFGPLDELLESFSLADAQRIKTIEARTNHDVKAVEYFLQEHCNDSEALGSAIPFLHFACTSEDINNLAYAMMVRDVRDHVLLPQLGSIRAALAAVASLGEQQPMLSRTHGQTASPTTMGKEVANVIARLDRQIAGLAAVSILGKFNGAVGNFNAHATAYPNVDWPRVSGDFIASLGLVANPLTTQIEPHDFLAEYFDALARANTVLLDYCRDTWGYISLGYFTQKRIEGEVGSSTMPHKVNPIDFENAEGNFGVANALLHHLATKLPISRWQRDLTDSTVLRTLGTAFGHTLVALNALQRGIGKLQLDPQRMRLDMDDAWEVLAEPIQTVMRRYGIADSYEALKALTRGQRIDKQTLHAFLDTLAIPEGERERLKNLTPATYTGLAVELSRSI